MTRLVMLFCCGLLAACGGAGDPIPGGADADPGAPDAAAPDAPDAAAPDAAPTELVQIDGDPYAPTSCAAECSGEGYACSAECAGAAGPVAGFATWVDDSGDIEFFHQADIATCAEPVPATYQEFGYVYDLYEYSCCCRAPAVQRIPGDIDAPAACDAVCGALGLACEPRTDWGFYGDGGMLVEYESAAGMSRSFAPENCQYVPPPTKLSGGFTYTLAAITCGCR